MKRIKHYFEYIVCLEKLIIAFVYILFHKRELYGLDIWLIQEKHTEARDNGYHLFKYVREEYPELNVFYSITKDSADRKKLEHLENLIDSDTIKHYIFYLSAKYNIGSQKFGACPYPTDWVNRFHFLCRKDQKVIFLQHGIIKDAAPGLDYYKTKFDLFVCSSQREYSYVHNDLNYPENNVKLVGLCRFDGLINSIPKKYILIMPTFRQWLAAQHREQFATNEECKRFKESKFYKEYAALLTDQSLISEAKKNDFKMIFYMHYSLQSYTPVFDNLNNDIVIIADRKKYDVQKLMVESSIMVTDFSSVFFDFAYMGKPELYFQFDEDEFREKHYGNGYFDYRRDGFGPVFINKNDVVDYLIRLMQSGCNMEQIYNDRVNSFFIYRDQCNCKRNYDAIMELEG